MTQSENKEGSTLFGGVTTAVRSQVPPAAKWLGASGVIPFITLAIAVLFLEGADQEAAYFAIAAYGAVILSFLGGIHWGLAVADGDQVAVDAANFIRLGGSVVPSLIGWGGAFSIHIDRPFGFGRCVCGYAFVRLAREPKSACSALVSEAEMAADNRSGCLAGVGRGRLSNMRQHSVLCDSGRSTLAG